MHGLLSFCFVFVYQKKEQDTKYEYMNETPKIRRNDGWVKIELFFTNNTILPSYRQNRPEQNISLFQINISGHSQVAYEKKLHTKYKGRVTDIISLLCGYIEHDGLIA